MITLKVHNAHYDRPNTLSLVAGDLRGQSVLDAGCGPGFYAQELASRGATVTAVDAVPYFVDMTRDRLAATDTKGHSVQRLDLTQGLSIFGDDSFDLVVCALVIDYVADIAALFHEFKRVLKPEGHLVMSIVHPIMDWKWINKNQPENVTTYFHTQLYTTRWRGFGEPYPEVTSYRRPLSAYINPLLDAGLHLDHFHEARPAESMKALSQTEYDKLNREPCFMMLRLKKPAL